ncbi:Aspartate aminotransferase [Fundidesulfovibrio magnetotacticus]|uniref:Aminotransferase n=1 Tax=Fundidesulfovibrio magnetotacticus TaxID=2730080 RepID=A0A6V8LWH2_9BACT|nr:pyridoxal phosphate-dependent aminotransferase [Fundidesulfovibrio magnetotacticus]GFK94007.1 Aspartate aminotransferase [Fundidesulfovibrio magnetotacticus]
MPNPACDQISSFIVMDILERACALERQGKHVIHLQIGEPDFDTPEPVKEAAVKAIRDGKTHYTHSLGLPALREAIAGHYRRAHGVEVSPERIVVTSGTSPAMLLTFSALVHQGEEVLLTDPHYACYPNFITYAGGRPRRVPTRPEDGFQFTPAALEQALAQTPARAVVLNSPSNPTGTLIPAGHLEAMCRMGAMVVSDEIYHGLTYDGEQARSALEFTDDCFVLNGFSKLWAMTGWRLGWVIAARRYIPAMQRLQQNFFISAGSVAQWAGISALNDCGVEVARMVEEYGRRRRVLIDGLARLGLKARVEPKGAFYVLVDARHIDPDSLRLARDILEKALVGVTPGVDFGPGAEGYLRFSYANSVENIEEGLSRLGRYLEARG